MKAAVAKKAIESSLARRFGTAFQRRDKRPAEILTTGVGEIDVLFNGFPRGAITEIYGTASSGRTSLLLSALAVATMHEEICALVDCSDTFDPASATDARVDFDRLLWVRCGGKLERAFKATDLLLQSGGFGLVSLNLSEVAVRYARRIISSWWFRFRHAIESTPTAFVVVAPTSCVRSCASVILEVKNERTCWPSVATLAFETAEVRLMAKEDKARTQRNSAQLSLVSESAPQVRNDASLLTHSILLRHTDVRAERRKPSIWTGGPARFSTRVRI